MKKNLKYILNIILLFNISLFVIIVFGFKYLKNKWSKDNIYTTNVVNIKNGKFIDPWYYGDRLDGHILHNISGKEVIVSSENPKYKYIEILILEDIELLQIDVFTRIISMKSRLKDIEFVYVVYFINKDDYYINESIEKNLANIQNNYNISICFVPENIYNDIYNLKNCMCGYSLFLDENNVVKSTINNLSISQLELIYNREKEQTGGSEKE